MSSNDHTLVSLISKLALSLDGAVLGSFIAFAAATTLRKYTSFSSALHKLRDAPAVTVSDLRSLVAEEHSSQSSDDSKLVVVRGTVTAKAADDGSCKVLKSETNEKSVIEAVIIQRTQKLIYNEWKGFMGWTYDLRATLAKPWREQEASTVTAVPFVLGGRGVSDFLTLNFDGSRHPLPLITVFQQKQLFSPNPYTFLQRIVGHDFPIGLRDEEKVLPLGMEVSAVGLFSFKNGVLEIKSCRNLPYFLSQMNKEELVIDLEQRTNALFWTGIGFGLLSVAILGYAAARNWNRWIEWRHRRQTQEASNAADSVAESPIDAEEEDVGDIPDGQLCVICLMRRRRSAFIPCGHLVCCHLCCISIEQTTSPKCPVCRQEIRTAMRIYDS